MIIDTDAMVSMRDANQNFSMVAKLAEKKGAVVILKNNKPNLIVMPYESVADSEETVSDDLIDAMTKQFADRYEEALKELAK